MHHAPLIIDVSAHQLSADDRRRLAHPLVGGVVHFARNWQTRAQLSALNAEIKSIRPDALICVDHEGGRVQRFKTDGFTHLPPMRALGRMYSAPEKKKHEGHNALLACRAACACGYVLAAELRACGVDLSFAPVLDLDWGRSAVMADRSFSADERAVAALAQQLMHGFLQAGMANCGKHFPGHGWARADSHVETPADLRSLKAILRNDAAPYGWLNCVLRAVMPAHVIYPKVDALPAGFSRIWLQDVLRARLGFAGAIISDDLNMQGALRIDGKLLSHAQAALAALDAGCDLLLLCNQSVLDDGRPIDALLDALEQAAAAGRWQPNPASEERRRALLPCTPAPQWDALMCSPAYMQAMDLLPAKLWRH